MAKTLPLNQFAADPPSLKSAIDALLKSADDVLAMVKNEPDRKNHTAAAYADLCFIELAVSEIRSALRHRKV
jgi:hypothetical protein